MLFTPLTWTVASPTGANRWGEDMPAVAFGNSRFLAAGYGGTGTVRITTSTDLADWTRLTAPSALPLSRDF